MTRAARPFSALLSVLLLSAAAGCTGQSNIGNPCDKAEQCGDGLICDFHDGKGTCQEPHGHGTEGETAETDDHAHETDDHAHETDDHATGSTSAGTGPTEATTEHGETEHDHTGTTADTTTSTG